MRGPRILIAEEEASLEICERLEALGYQTAGWAVTGEQALEMAEKQTPDLVLMDIRLPGEMDGVETAIEIGRRLRKPVIFLTSHAEEETWERAKLADPYGFIFKPFSDRDLKISIELALRRHGADREIRRLSRLCDVLSQVSRTLAKVDCVEKLLPDICRLLVERGEIDLAWIGRLDETGSRLSPVASCGERCELLENSRFPAAFPAEGRDFPEGSGYESQTLVYNDCDRISRFHPGAGFGSCGSFPLRLRGGARGALNICLFEPDFFGDREIDLLARVARDVSSAFERIDGDVTSVKEAEELLRIEWELAFQLGSANGLDEALSHLLDACLQLPPLDSGGVYLVGSPTGDLSLALHRGLPESFAECVSHYGPDSAQARFARKDQPGYWSKTAGIFDTGDLLVREGLASLAVIPVKAEETVIAVLVLASRSQSEIPPNVRGALEVMAAQIGGFLSRLKLMDTIRAQSERLQEANSALRTLLRQREEDKTALEESLVTNVRRLILPCLEKLKAARTSDHQGHYWELLESHLRDITSPFVRRLSAPLLGLTPMEMRVADLIRRGKRTKEIADLFALSEHAVNFHRQNIRKKLGLTAQKLNLQTYLGAFPQ